MLPTYLLKKYQPSMGILVILMSTLLFMSPTYAQTINTSASAESMLIHFAQQVPNLMRLVTAVAYVIGMYFIFYGVMQMKHMGEMRTMMSQEHGFAKPLLSLFIGAMLLYLPTTVQVGLSTFWTNPNPYGYLQEQSQWNEFLNNAFMIVQLIGVIAFIRGLLMISHLGRHGGQSGSGRGLTHIVAGIFCINIYQFVQVVLSTFGLST